MAGLCCQENVAKGMYYSWSKEFLEAGKKWLADDTARAATSDEVKYLKREAQNLKEVVAEQADRVSQKICAACFRAPRINSATDRRTAIACLVRIPCRYMPLRLPSGAPAFAP
jgi:hypothetical protein